MYHVKFLNHHNKSYMNNRSGVRALALLLTASMLSAAAYGCGAAEEGTEAGSQVEETEAGPEGYTLIWSDEFDGDALDLSKWSYQLGNGADYGVVNWGNGEAQYYTDRPENISVGDGMLTITVQKENPSYEGYSYTSARIRTLTDDNEALFATAFGRVEARIQMIGGSGIWPAFWMLPADTSIYGEWASSGELDIMEAMLRLPDQVGGTAHFGKTWPNNTYKTSEYHFAEGESVGDFHVYAMEWDPTEIRWYVDDECYHVMNDWFSKGTGHGDNFTNPAPFDVPFYILLNVAVGGSYDPLAVLSDASLPGAMNVDYVRVYQRDEGYDAMLAEAHAKEDGIDTEASRTPRNNGNIIYNGCFDEGTNFLGYWITNRIEVHVDPYDYARRVAVTATADDGSLSQTGIGLQAGCTYGVRFDMTSDAECQVIARILLSDGSLLSEEVLEVKVAEDYIYAYTFECPVDDDHATLELIFPADQELILDNVIMMNLTSQE